jgi:7-carboxy-7-deazaguanine synthase
VEPPAAGPDASRCAAARVAMFIAETFTSIQGEGELAGVLSFFIRTSGCNLRCAWCDTPYASWRPEGRRRAVAELVSEAAAAGRRHVVITGGEPLLQRELGPLTRALAAAGHHITVETAGTLEPEFECSLLSVSPKTSNSDPEGRFCERHRRLRADVEPLIGLLKRHREHQLKFVVRDESDIPEVLALVKLVSASPERVLLMPEGRSAAAVAQRQVRVARMCLQHGFRYSPRLQLDLFGGGRGV